MLLALHNYYTKQAETGAVELLSHRAGLSWTPPSLRAIPEEATGSHKASRKQWFMGAMHLLVANPVFTSFAQGLNGPLAI